MSQAIIIIIILNGLYHTFNYSGAPSCRFCHTPHSSSGRSLIKKFDYNFLEKEFNFELKPSELFCLLCHTSKQIMTKTFSENAFLNSLSETSHIFLEEKTGAHINYDLENREITCSTCHDVHRNTFYHALRKTPFEICTACHTEYKYTMTEHYGAGCEECHKVHKLENKEEDQKCMECHKNILHDIRENCGGCHKIHKEER